MSGQSEIQRTLDGYLSEGPDRVADQALARALDAVDRTQQRRGLLAPWRFPRMNTYTRLAAAAAVAVVALGGALYLIGPRPGVGGPSATPSASSVPSGTAGPATFRSSNFAVPISIVLAEGWDDWRVDADETNVVALHQTSSGYEINLMNLPTMTVRGPTPSAAWVSWPADPTAWFDARPEFTPVATRNITANGRPAVLFDVDTVADQIADTGDWVKYGPGHSDGFNLRDLPSPDHMRLVIIPTGPTTGIVAIVDAGATDYVALFALLDRVLANLVVR